MAEPQPSKLVTWVRFPSPAPAEKAIANKKSHPVGWLFLCCFGHSPAIIARVSKMNYEFYVQRPRNSKRSCTRRSRAIGKPWSRPQARNLCETCSFFSLCRRRGLSDRPLHPFGHLLLELSKTLAQPSQSPYGDSSPRGRAKGKRAHYQAVRAQGMRFILFITDKAGRAVVPIIIPSRGDCAQSASPCRTRQ